MLFLTIMNVLAMGCVAFMGILYFKKDRDYIKLEGKFKKSANVSDILLNRLVSKHNDVDFVYGVGKKMGLDIEVFTLEE